LDPQEFTVKQATAADLIGARVGHAYVLTGVLGTGGMGNVFRASQETIGRDVAIKFLPLEIATDATAVQRLGREAKALGQLNHPGIVTTFDFGFTDKREPYLVLELVEGKSLQTILDQEKRLEMARALQIFVQLCEAMSYAHSQGIIHRDLKPLNIMIGIREQFGFAKILDFGIVKLTSEVQQLTKSGEIWGSPFYMSPEQCTGGTVDNRSDIYSLGVVMFRSLTGEVPHRGASFPETIARKLSEYPPSFESIAPGLNLPDKLEAVVLKCMQKNPDERFATMQELRAELLKNYPNRLESEATLTYEKVDAVTQASKAKTDQAKTDQAITDHLSLKQSSSDNAGTKQLAIVVLSLLVLLGAMAAGIFSLYQNQKIAATKLQRQAVSNQQKNTSTIDGAGNASITPSLRNPPSSSKTAIVQSSISPAVGSPKPAIKTEKKATKKAPTKPMRKKASQAAVPPRSKSLREILRRTGQEVLQEIRPLRRLRQNDPNSFYRDFGGR
jgi:serine/threonine protein kinase